jgi:hypothetical protein
VRIGAASGVGLALGGGEDDGAVAVVASGGVEGPLLGAGAADAWLDGALAARITGLAGTGVAGVAAPGGATG